MIFFKKKILTVIYHISFHFLFLLINFLNKINWFFLYITDNFSLYSVLGFSSSYKMFCYVIKNVLYKGSISSDDIYQFKHINILKKNQLSHVQSF